MNLVGLSFQPESDEVVKRLPEKRVLVRLMFDLEVSIYVTTRVRILRGDFVPDFIFGEEFGDPDTRDQQLIMHITVDSQKTLAIVAV